jgi:hypothetical protein
MSNKTKQRIEYNVALEILFYFYKTKRKSIKSIIPRATSSTAEKKTQFNHLNAASLPMNHCIALNPKINHQQNE